ncbi:biotin-dependent carboxyltransferase family protein [Psychromonas antarctica]|uniref:5-oxoprolinase subunit C family protein n=1 Tax=Psychromonas antarctica TaxID=67573 RepID=UPI001EE88B07|nr:biotin-dependent carboxyltransferase family protein [Psychromonas antarctica]MCG6201282.1 biotin-dependent carboxyltransferase family protein [Psychromonas antarctica]
MKSNSGLYVLNAGVFSQLQDLGRYGQAKQGLSQGGVGDPLAAGWANYLLKNSADKSLIEISFGQAEFIAECDLQLAITGAEMSAFIVMPSGQKKAQSNNRSFVLKKGQGLKFGFASSGVRAYLAVKGGFNIRKKYGSCSTVTRNFIGGLDGTGSNLKNGDRLSAFEQLDRLITTKIPEQFIPDYNSPLTLGVIEAYQCEYFSSRQKAMFYNIEYTIGTQSDRMGLRLTGKSIGGLSKGIISEGIALGSIQIPADGLPIILLQDRQTLGGYPKIGCVARCDLNLLVQKSAGEKIRFKPTCLADQQQRYLQRLRFFNQFK